MGFLRGLIYCYLWLASIFAGYAVFFCVIFPIIFLSNRLYRCWTNQLLATWQLYPSILMELIYNCKVHVSGDKLMTSDTCLLVMNHRTRMDWTFLWPASYQWTGGNARIIYPLKFVLKDEIRHIPGIGWLLALSGNLFIKRDWAIDKLRIQRATEYYTMCGWKYSMLIFPEGTDLTPHTKARSDEYAVKHNLPCYEYVLHPKTTGFTYLYKALKDQGQLDYLYDVTIAYCDTIPQTERSLFHQFPNNVNIHLKRYSMQTVKSEEQLKQFLEELWAQKEIALKEFYTNGMFIRGEPLIQKDRISLYVILGLWTLMPVIAVDLLLRFQVFFYIVIAHTLLLLVIDTYFGGFQNFEIGVYNFKKRWRLTWLY